MTDVLRVTITRPYFMDIPEGLRREYNKWVRSLMSEAVEEMRRKAPTELKKKIKLLSRRGRRIKGFRYAIAIYAPKRQIYGIEFGREGGGYVYPRRKRALSFYVDKDTRVRKRPSAPQKTLPEFGFGTGQKQVRIAVAKARMTPRRPYPFIRPVVKNLLKKMEETQPRRTRIYTRYVKT